MLQQDIIKLVLLGNSGVGKTSIISRYIENIFNINESSTYCSNFFEKIITKNKKNYLLNIWDTAGQEKYHSLGKHFYKDAHIICFVFDYSNQKSLNSIIETWYPEVKIYGERCVAMGVVGNKCDLYENEDVAAVNEEEANKFANDINAVYKLVSAKNGDGINTLFEDLLDKYLEKDAQEKINEISKNRETSISIESSKGQKNKKCC